MKAIEKDQTIAEIPSKSLMMISIKATQRDLRTIPTVLKPSKQKRRLWNKLNLD